MYLNNCRYGLHGPIEVVSREAVAIYLANMHRCDHIRVQPFGEDKYLRRCLDLLGVRKSNQFGVLNEFARGQKNPFPCTSASVAFHPFKTVESYFSCWQRGAQKGEWV